MSYESYSARMDALRAKKEAEYRRAAERAVDAILGAVRAEFQPLSGTTPADQRDDARFARSVAIDQLTKLVTHIAVSER